MSSPETSVQLAIRGPIARSDLPGLYRRACAALDGCRDGLLLCNVTGVAGDAVCLDALARLALGARRHDCRVLLRGANPDLRALVDLAGLAEVLLCE